MNETIQYFIKNIKEHPIQSVVTTLTGIGVLFTLISNTHVDLFITSQEVKANAQQISQLSESVAADHNSILILQQIAKDNVDAQKIYSSQLQQLNANFTQYLLDKIK